MTGSLGRIRAILFDLDGTLIDTTDLILRCFEHAWQNVCGISHSRQALVATFGMPLREAMHRLMDCQLAVATTKPTADALQRAAQVETLLTTYRAYNVAHHDVVARPFADTWQAVTRLRERGYRLGVVTSKSRELGERGLQLCGLAGLLDDAVFLEDTTRHKPSPEPILTALERLEVAADEAVYVGDSFHDIIAGRAAGVKTIAAAWGPLPRADLERERPDWIAESITDLLKIFP